MMKISHKNLLFILGTPRSGKKLLKCLLDGHSELLVWPDEFPYFAIFKSLEDLDKKVQTRLLNKIIIHSITKRISSHLENENNLNLGDFNVSRFINNLMKFKDQRMSSLDYLIHLSSAYYKSYKKYTNRNIKYFVLTCSGQGFDWSNKTLLNESTFIWVNREVQDAYASFREKTLMDKEIKLYDFYKPTLIKGAMWQLHLYALLEEKYNKNISRDNFFSVSLNKLKQKPDTSIKNINKELGIRFENTQNNLTILSEPYEGNFIGKRIKSSKIINTSSALKTPITEFEFHCISYISKREMDLNFDVDIMYLLLKTAFSKNTIPKPYFSKNIFIAKFFQVLFGFVLLYRLLTIFLSLKKIGTNSYSNFAKDKYISCLVEQNYEN